MPTAVEMPKLSNTVEECLVSHWVKRKGDAVAAGDLVAEIETDKATFEVTSPIDGVLLETFFDEGALVPVFTNLFVVGQPGESAEPFRPGAAENPPGDAAAEPAPVLVENAPAAEVAENGRPGAAYSPRA